MTNRGFEDPREREAPVRWWNRWEWAEDWSFAMAALLALVLVGAVIVYAAGYPRTASLPVPSTTGQGIPGPLTPASP
jgi:hypothetical protein